MQLNAGVDKEFNSENVLGKMVFLSLYTSFLSLFIPAVLGKMGDNGIEFMSLHS